MGGVERSRTNMEQKRGSLAKAICGTANDGQLRPNSAANTASKVHICR